MQPFPLPYEPDNLRPCMTLRSRREVNTSDATNTRLVEHWQTDAPSQQFARRDVPVLSRWQDMNPTPSRLYRESLAQAPSYQLPGANTPLVKKTMELNNKVNDALLHVQNAKDNASLQSARKKYESLLLEQKQVQVDALAENPYFDKYDVATDSRNVIRELRGVVSEDVVDRGLRESQRLLAREMQNRWLPAHYAEDRGYDQLNAYELLRPKFGSPPM